LTKKNSKKIKRFKFSSKNLFYFYFLSPKTYFWKFQHFKNNIICVEIAKEVLWYWFGCLMLTMQWWIGLKQKALGVLAWIFINFCTLPSIDNVVCLGTCTSQTPLCPQNIIEKKQKVKWQKKFGPHVGYFSCCQFREKEILSFFNNLFGKKNYEFFF
jgi:hypothetical protein